MSSEYNKRECEKWMEKFRLWKNGLRATMTDPKPRGLDFYLQGTDPLGVEMVKTIRCHGGGLVPEDWSPSAIITKESGDSSTQLPLL